jgi:hypothetical protein
MISAICDQPSEPPVQECQSGHTMDVSRAPATRGKTFFPTAVWAANRCVIDLEGRNLASSGVTSFGQSVGSWGRHLVAARHAMHQEVVVTYSRRSCARTTHLRPCRSWTARQSYSLDRARHGRCSRRLLLGFFDNTVDLRFRANEDTRGLSVSSGPLVPACTGYAPPRRLSTPP